MIGDYNDEYVVYRLPARIAELVGKSWQGLTEAGERIGTLPVRALRLDPTRRKYLHTSAFAGIRPDRR